MNNMDLISEGKPVILPYLPSDMGEVTFERWKTKVKFFYSHYESTEKCLSEVEDKMNDFFNTKDRELCDMKMNMRLDSLYDKVIVLAKYKERVE